MEQLSQEELMNDLLAGKGLDTPVHYKEGTVVFAQGKMSKYLYLVKKGEVNLMKAKGNGLDIIQICGAKDILNEVAVLTNKANEFTAIATTDIELVLVDHKEILSVIKNSPKWIPDIFQTLCERLRLTQEMISEHNLDQEKDSRLFITKEDEGKYLAALKKFNMNN